MIVSKLLNNAFIMDMSFGFTQSIGGSTYEPWSEVLGRGSLGLALQGD